MAWKPLLFLACLAATGCSSMLSRPQSAAVLAAKTGGEWNGGLYVGGSFMPQSTIDLPRMAMTTTTGSYYLQFEGPAWESETIGYRYVADDRHVIDVLPKRQRRIGLAKEALHAQAEFRKPGYWVDDVFHIGDGIGCGTPVFWVDGRAQRVGPVERTVIQNTTKDGGEASVALKNTGRRIGGAVFDETLAFSIRPGSRLTRVSATVSDSAPPLCAGFVANKTDTMIPPPRGEGAWSWLASWGARGSDKSSFGVAVFYRKADAMDAVDDRLNHVVRFPPATRRIEYSFLAAWDQEEDGIKDRAGFEKLLTETLAQLNGGETASHN